MLSSNASERLDPVKLWEIKINDGHGKLLKSQESIQNCTTAGHGDNIKAPFTQSSRVQPSHTWVMLRQ